MSQPTPPEPLAPGAMQTSVPTVAAPAGPWSQISTPATPTATPSTMATTPLTATPFTWQGNPWSLTGACLLNAVMMLLTLGIYGFWGRTEIRRRMWSSIRFMGEPLAYHGTPQELLKGFFAVMGAVLLPLFVVGIAVVIFFGQASSWFVSYQMALFLGIYPVLAAIAYYRARRFRLSRTSWRGVRGSIVGSSSSYGFLSWALAWAYPFTLGWIAPYRAVALNRKIVMDTQLGDRQLTFNGTSGTLYGPYALLWFGTIVLYFVVFGTLGAIVGTRFNPANPGNPFTWTTLTSRDWAFLIGAFVVAITLWSVMSSFYYAKLYNLCAASTFMLPSRQGDQPLRFKLEVGGMKLIWLYVTNMLITYLSLYVLRPVATARSMKYYIEHLSLEGAFDGAAVGQNRALLDQSGEGLGQAFDLDAF